MNHEKFQKRREEIRQCINAGLEGGPVIISESEILAWFDYMEDLERQVAATEYLDAEAQIGANELTAENERLKAELAQARAAAEKLAHALIKGPCVGCPLFETDCYRREKNREDGVKCREEILEWAYLPTPPKHGQP